ncbi:hypothetical protein ABZW03_00855 [Kitasatospora sp. NPDC004799]|uniref:hypothetical protein n=1 Tax=Kitasatospora sp. NPDC004799 TaxID=3154460 RepID=UPI0033A29EDC
MDTVLASLIAVIGTLTGSLGTIHLQQRATRRAVHRHDLQSAGGQLLTALTAYRAAVYALWTANTTNPDADNPPTEQITTVRIARAALTAARDALFLLTTDTAVRDAVHNALDATFALGDDQEQDQITTGRPAALAAHHTLLDALAAAIKTA